MWLANLPMRRGAYGVDITGYVRPSGFTPSLAVLCPECAQRGSWRCVARLGEPLTAEGYESIGAFGARCEACGAEWAEWRVPQA